jgi:predicted GNAT family acetyltransferase
MAEKENTDGLAVVNNEKAGRFEIEARGSMAMLTYRLLGNSILLDHTEVPRELEGHGIGSQLVREALEFARLNGLRVVPICPFVVDYLRKHPEYQDLLSPGGRKRLGDDKTRMQS